MKKIKNLSFIFIVIFLFASVNNLYANGLSPQQEQLTKTDNRMEDVFGTFYSTPDLTPSQPFDYSKGFGGGDTPDPGGNDDDGEFDPLPDPIPVGNGWYILLIFGIIFAGLKTLKKRQNMKRLTTLFLICVLGFGYLSAQNMVLREKWNYTHIKDSTSANPWVAAGTTTTYPTQSGTYLRDDIGLSADGTKLYVLRRNCNPGMSTETYDNNVLEIWNPTNGAKIGSVPNPSDPTSDANWPYAYKSATVKATNNYFRNGGAMSIDETGAVWIVNVTISYNDAFTLYRYTSDNTAPTLMYAELANTLGADGVCRLGYGIYVTWNEGNGYVLLVHDNRDEILYLPLENGSIDKNKLKRLTVPSAPAIRRGMTPNTPQNGQNRGAPTRQVDGTWYYGILINAGDTLWKTYTNYYGLYAKLGPTTVDHNTFWYDANGAMPLFLSLDTTNRFNPIFSSSILSPFKGIEAGGSDSINIMACGASSFLFQDQKYLFMGSNNHSAITGYIARNMHQLYEVSNEAITDTIKINRKLFNIPVSGGMGGQTNDNGSTVHGIKTNDTINATTPKNVHLYAFAAVNGAISYVMEEEVTFGLIGDAGIAHGWDPENPVVFKKISDSLYYTRITVLNDSSKERRFTIMHKNKKYPNWNEHNRLDGDRYTQWATVTKGAGVQNVSGKTIFEPSTAFSRGDVVGVVVKYKDTTDYNSYVANNSYTLYVDSMKYRLKVDVGDVTYTSNKLFGDGTFSIYAPQNTNIYLQGWLANEWVNIGEPFQYTTDSTVIKVTFTFDTETLGTPVKYEYPEGFYIRTNIATGGTTDYTNPTKNNAMTRFARAGETLDDYYWVTDIKAGTNNVKAVVANVYNPEITNWEATAKTASSASAIRFLYNTRNNQLERVQAKSGTLTAGGYAVTVDSTNHWATKVEIPDYKGNSTTLTSTGDTGLSTLSKTVPAQTGFDGAMTLGIDYDFKTDKLSNPQWVVRNDENFTVATTKTSAPNVLVRDSGQVTGTVTGSGTITIEKNYSLTTSGVTTRNHWISFPFAVNINEITGDSICHGVQKYDLQSKYGRLWRIVYYNTALKGSTNGASAPYWTAMANTATLEAGKGYVLQFTNKVTGQPKFYYHSASNYTMNDAAQGSVTLTATTGTNANHQNWYLIGNPFFAKTKINGGPLCWVRVNSDYSNYDYYLARDYNELPTSTSFFVQYAGDVTFTTKATNAASPAPMLAAQENDGFEYYLLTLSNNSIKKRLGVILSDDGSNDYVYGRDMALMAEDSSIVRFYSIHGYNLVFNNIKKQNQTVALGYYTTTAGTHTISIAQKDVPEDSRVTLYDAVKDRTTDLLTSDYTFDTETGTFDNRFTLYINKSTTDCNQILNSNLIIRQEEQNLIIENVTSGDKLQLFHISGKCVAQITADNTTVCFPNLTKGMYILTANNKQTKIVIK